MSETKKTETLVAVATEKVATTKKAVAKAEKPKAEKVLTMSQVKSLARANGITFVRCKNSATSYVIFDGKSSLHIKKSGYRMYVTAADYELIKCLNLTNTALLENANSIDKCRPHTVNIGNNADLKFILAAIAVNNHIELK